MPTGIYKHKKQSGFQKGAKHSLWKGNNVSYAGLHMWIKKYYGKPVRCEICGTAEIPKGKKRWFEWSCKNGKYTRDIGNWWQLCIPCHREYDNWSIKMIKTRKSNSSKL